jgi:hypothetical protein
MTLEQRLVRRLREWQHDARKLRNVIEALHLRDEARASLEKELGRLNSCIEGVAADLMARNGKPKHGDNAD